MENKSRDSLNCDIATDSLFNIFAKEKCSQSFYSLATDKSADSFCAKIYLVHPPHWIVQTCGTAHFVHNLAQENWAFTLGEMAFQCNMHYQTDCYQLLPTYANCPRSILENKRNRGQQLLQYFLGNVKSPFQRHWLMYSGPECSTHNCTAWRGTCSSLDNGLRQQMGSCSGSHLCLFIHLSQLNLGVILKQGSTVLHFSFLDPVAVNSEGTAINHLSQCLDAIWVGPCDVQREWLRCVS